MSDSRAEAGGEDPMLTQLAAVASRLSAFEAQRRVEPAAPWESGAAARGAACSGGSTPQTEAQCDHMMSGLLRRLDAHASMVNRDQGTSPPPPTMATAGSEMRKRFEASRTR